MYQIKNIKLEIHQTHDDLKAKCQKLFLNNPITTFEILKWSIDARDKEHIFYLYTCIVELKNKPKYLPKNVEDYTKPLFKLPKKKEFEKKPIIVGAGPSGLFAAYLFALSDIPCILIERGKCVEKRALDIEKLLKEGFLNPESNIQFGEGGAGTYSDGKLTTGNKDERLRFILETFVKFGAQKDILSSYKPHIGSDYLKIIMKNMRAYLLEHHVEIRFETKMTNIFVKENQLVGIVVNDNETITTNHLLVGVGHSARDTYEMLYEMGLAIEAKSFAVGVRIEHKQEMIQKAQFGKFAQDLTPSDYKLVTHLNNGRTVYSFCVCPGGVVVAAASEENMVVTNGMSEFKRDQENINGAILVNVTPEDCGTHPLSGITFQRDLEKKAFLLAGSNYAAPAQLWQDFKMKKKSINPKSILPSYSPKVTYTNLHEILPSFVAESILEAIPMFANKIKNFDHPDAILTGIETRSSAPIRMIRNPDYQSNIVGLFPIGEGAGYAGGIMSAALDGLKCAYSIIDSE